MSDKSQCHRDVLEAFQRIELSGMLSWAVLDQKPEKYITVALAAALNGERRRALTEHMRLDLVLIDQWAHDRNHQLSAGYEAKCEHLARFEGGGKARGTRRPTARRDGKESANSDWYNGGCLKADLGRAGSNVKKWQGFPVRGGLFYVVEMSPSTDHSKFLPRDSGDGLTARQAMERIERCVGKKMFGVAQTPATTVSIGDDRKVEIRLHAVLFDASPSGGG